MKRTETPTYCLPPPSLCLLPTVHRTPQPLTVADVDDSVIIHKKSFRSKDPTAHSVQLRCHVCLEQEPKADALGKPVLETQRLDQLL